MLHVLLVLIKLLAHTEATLKREGLSCSCRPKWTNVCVRTGNSVCTGCTHTFLPEYLCLLRLRVALKKSKSISGQGCQLHVNQEDTMVYNTNYSLHPACSQNEDSVHTCNGNKSKMWWLIFRLTSVSHPKEKGVWCYDCACLMCLGGRRLYGTNHL